MNEWLERNRIPILAAIGLVLGGGIVLILLRYRQPETITINPPPPTETPGPIEVYVSGAVSNPAVYQLPPDAIVQDALQAAGGPTSEADLEAINLAKSLSSGEQIVVPAQGEPAPPPAASSGEEIASGPININTASATELESLPGIGPALAERIITYREENGPFAAIEDIQNVSGIGPSTFEDIQELITVE